MRPASAFSELSEGGTPSGQPARRWSYEVATRMSDWIGLGILIAFALGIIFGLRYLSRPRDLSAEEFEKRAAEGTSLVGAGLADLQKFLDPSKEKRDRSDAGDQTGPI